MTAPLPRKRFPVWPVAIAALLLLWAGALLVLKYGSSRAPSTGDALLDAYLEIADESGGIPKDKRPELEKRFAGDPRSWELVTTDIGIDYNYKPVDKVEDSAYAQYYELMHKGQRPKSVYLLDRYLSVRENLWETEYGVDSPRRDPNAPRPTSAERLALGMKHDRLTSRSIDEQHSTERTHLHDELCAAAPDASHVWYRKAHLHYQRNQYEQALECVRKGNAAPDSHRLHAFPLRDYVDSFEGKGPLVGHPLAYRLAMPLLVSTTPDFVQVKRTHFALWYEATQKNDRAALNDLHRYACRVGMSDREILSGLVCDVLLKHEAKEMLKLPGLTVQQQTDIGTFTARTDTIKNQLRSMNSSSPSAKHLGNPAGGGLMGHLRGESHDLNSRIMHDDYKWTRAEYEKRIMPELEALSKFDFLTLSFKP